MSYWLGFVAQKGYMTRADLDPSDIVPLLPHIGLIDILPGDFRYRLVGTHMNSMFGIDFTGGHLKTVKSGRYAQFLWDLYRLCAEQRMPVLSDSVFEYHDKPNLSIKRMVLPLRPTSEAPVNMLLFANTFRTRTTEDPGVTSSSAAVTARPFLQDNIKSFVVLNEVVLSPNEKGLETLLGMPPSTA
jgi:hypothetical protein